MSDSMMIANTILKQIKAMDKWALASWGVKDAMSISEQGILDFDKSCLGGLQFKVRGSKIKTGGRVCILLNGLDLYDVVLGTVRNKNGVPTWEIKKTVENIYAENLISVIDGLVG